MIAGGGSLQRDVTYTPTSLKQSPRSSLILDRPYLDPKGCKQQLLFGALVSEALGHYVTYFLSSLHLRSPKNMPRSFKALVLAGSTALKSPHLLLSSVASAEGSKVAQHEVSMVSELGIEIMIWGIKSVISLGL